MHMACSLNFKLYGIHAAAEGAANVAGVSSNACLLPRRSFGDRVCCRFHLLQASKCCLCSCVADSTALLTCSVSASMQLVARQVGAADHCLQYVLS
jgi:hypothetical protein